MAAAAGAVAIAVASIAAARQDPAWYAARLAPRDPAGADRDARRAVTAVSGLQAAAGRPGAWGAALREDEVNAWLATMLPRNHATLLPRGMTAPRVAFEPGRIRVAARVAAGPLGGTLSLVLEPRLRAGGQLECGVREARLGAIPLPAGPFVHRLAALCGRAGVPADVRRLDGHTAIVVSWSSRGTVLAGLSVSAGEIVVAGTTEEVR